MRLNLNLNYHFEDYGKYLVTKLCSHTIADWAAEVSLRRGVSYKCFMIAKHLRCQALVWKGGSFPAALHSKQKHRPLAIYVVVLKLTVKQQDVFTNEL